jgi:hypothetical protein
MRPNFAKSYKTLAQAVTAPLFEWDARYPLPADYLSLICTYPDKIEFEIVETDLYCNEAAMSIKYIKRVTDTTKWTPLFADAVTYKLAERIAPALKDAAREGMTTMYQESRRLTKADTGLETGSKPIMADDFIDVRYIN